MKIAIQTLGCKVNQSESASIHGVLRNNNFEVVSSADSPDVYIINTCSVTAKSDYQSRQLVRKGIKSGAKVIATGCYAQLRPGDLSGIEGLSYVIGNSDKDRLISCIKELSGPVAGKNGKKACEILVNRPDAPLSAQPYHSSRSRAFLKIQDGCNFSCSYCTVPYARGRSRSMNEEDVMSSVRDLVEQDYREIVLTGIHTGSYGLDLIPKSSLLIMVKKVVRRYPQIRIRLSSLEPQEFDMEFLSLIHDGSVCSHLHIPLQSGSDKILKAMNRGYRTDYFEQLINNIVTGCPEISIGTDLITGFPGESDKDFNETVNLISKLPLTYLHVFPYSKRPDTRAELLTDQISDKVKKERVSTLIEIGKSKLISYITGNYGKVLQVVVEGKSENGRYYKGISSNYLRVLIDSDKIMARDCLKVQVTSLTESELIAKPLK